VLGNGGGRREIYRGEGGFCPRRSHHPGLKGLLSLVVASPGTKGVFWRAGKFPAYGPLLVSGGSTTRDKRGPFSLLSAKSFSFSFVFSYFSFKIGFHLLIE
jgi:hypothetical protein